MGDDMRRPRKRDTSLVVGQHKTRTSFTRSNVSRNALRQAAEPQHDQSAFRHEELNALLDRCFKRICGWRVPPNWSLADWREEIRAHGLGAAYEAIRDFDASRGVPFDAFVYERVITRAYSRFRQEWAYGLRCISSPAEFVSHGGLGSGELGVQHGESTIEPGAAYQFLLDTLGALSEPNHRLIMQIFWEGKTEVKIAEILGVSHQAVSKRKRAILEKLRMWLKD